MGAVAVEFREDTRSGRESEQTCRELPGSCPLPLRERVAALRRGVRGAPLSDLAERASHFASVSPLTRLVRSCEQATLSRKGRGQKTPARRLSIRQGRGYSASNRSSDCF